MKKDTCTVYLLTNKANGKIYIGQTWMTLEDRMGRDGGNYSNSPYLYNAIIYHGYQNFQYTVIKECTTQEEADQSETENIIKYCSQDPTIGYNIKHGGSAGLHTEETKAKISKTLSEMEKTPEQMEFIRNLGYQWKDKERGPQTEERKEHVANVMKEWHAVNEHPMLGKHHTEEAKEKMRIALTGKKRPAEVSEKIGLALRMDPERERGIVADYLEGKTAAQIMEKYDIHTSGIYRVIERNNIPKRGEKGKGLGRKHTPETIAKISKPRRILSVETEQEIIKDYLDGISVAKLLKKFKIGETLIYKTLEKNNIPKRSK